MTNNFQLTTFNFLAIILMIIAQLLFSDTCFAMGSGTYTVPNDVLNASGTYSSSATYKLWDNLGEFVTGESSSATYKNQQGFLQNDIPYLSMSISAATVNFGTLSTLSVSTGSTVVTISSNSLQGYALKAYDDTSAGVANGLVDGVKKIADATTPGVYIANPGAGTEHYGITVTGTHANAGYAGGTKINSLDDTTWVNIGSHTTFAKDDAFTVQYRASIAALSPASNNLSATTTFIVIGNY